jgi:hypothetical protein
LSLQLQPKSSSSSSSFDSVLLTSPSPPAAANSTSRASNHRCMFSDSLNEPTQSVVFNPSYPYGSSSDSHVYACFNFFSAVSLSVHLESNRIHINGARRCRCGHCRLPSSPLQNYSPGSCHILCLPDSYFFPSSSSSSSSHRMHTLSLTPNLNLACV